MAAGMGWRRGDKLIPGMDGPSKGIAAAAILGVGGVVGGAAAGAALEKDSTTGLPPDELFVYKDALKQGRSVIFVEACDHDEAEKAHAVLANAGAESIDAAREEWWIGLRSAEEEHYRALGGNFENAERDYRRCFEAALRHNNGTASADRAESEAYRRGYERGTATTSNSANGRIGIPARGLINDLETEGYRSPVPRAVLANEHQLERKEFRLPSAW
jgi:hypothetical protein